MHLMLSLVGGHGIILLGSRYILDLLHRMEQAPRRRLLPLSALALPLVSVLVLVMGTWRLVVPHCLLDRPGWSRLLALLLVLGMGGTLLGAILLGLGRHLVLLVIMRRQQVSTDPQLEARVQQVARALPVSRFRVRVVPGAQPVALLYGMRRPTLLLSTWIFTHLDQEEVEAVLTHELAHALHSDYVVSWVAMILRDAFCYLPTSWYAYRQFLQAKELACDDQVVHITKRPLALASALTKVWLSQHDDSLLPGAQTLTNQGEGITQRINRLLTMTPAQSAGAVLSSPGRSRRCFGSALLLVMAVNVALAAILALY